MMECHFHQSHSRQGTKKKNFSVEVLESLYSNKLSTHLDTSHVKPLLLGVLPLLLCPFYVSPS